MSNIQKTIKWITQTLYTHTKILRMCYKHVKILSQNKTFAVCNGKKTTTKHFFFLFEILDYKSIP